MSYIWYSWLTASTNGIISWGISAISDWSELKSPAFIWANTWLWDSIGGDVDGVWGVVELEAGDGVEDEGETDVWVLIGVGVGIEDGDVELGGDDEEEVDDWGVELLDEELDELLLCELDELGGVDGGEDVEELLFCELAFWLAGVDVWVLADDDGVDVGVGAEDVWVELLLCEVDEEVELDCVDVGVLVCVDGGVEFCEVVVGDDEEEVDDWGVDEEDEEELDGELLFCELDEETDFSTCCGEEGVSPTSCSQKYIVWIGDWKSPPIL